MQIANFVTAIIVATGMPKLVGEEQFISVLNIGRTRGHSEKEPSSMEHNDEITQPMPAAMQITPQNSIEVDPDVVP